ncbi:hypothetical protein JCM14036_25250 [Desulfotomaculum defluvii]
MPAKSLAMQVTVVVPTSKNSPEGGSQVNDTKPQLSDKIGMYSTIAPHALKSLGTVMSGQVIFGGSVSMTVIAKLHEDVLSDASVAMQVTALVPTGKKEPEGGLQAKVTPGQFSNIRGLGYKTFAPHRPGSLGTIMS